MLLSPSKAAAALLYFALKHMHALPPRALALAAAPRNSAALAPLVYIMTAAEMPLDCGRDALRPCKHQAFVMYRMPCLHRVASKRYNGGPQRSACQRPPADLGVGAAHIYSYNSGRGCAHAAVHMLWRLLLVRYKAAEV